MTDLRPESFVAADVEAGRVGADQAPPPPGTGF
jgi:hypothetical protein